MAEIAKTMNDTSPPPSMTTAPLPTGTALKNLMLELLYPAVLGTIMYNALDHIADQVGLGRLALGGHNSIHFDFVVSVKSLLLITTLFFYLFDYLYVMFTKAYRPLFFVFDLAFLSGLYATARVIKLSDHAQLPSARVIAVAYVVFLALYLRWDWLERPARESAERDLYTRIIKWEFVSIGILVAYVGLISVTGNTVWVSMILAIVLVPITAHFGWLTWSKRKFAVAITPSATNNAETGTA